MHDYRSRVYEWFSFSHWGMFWLPIATCPDWFADGIQVDDDLIERLDDDGREIPFHDLASIDPIHYNQFL